MVMRILRIRMIRRGITFMHASHCTPYALLAMCGTPAFAPELEVQVGWRESARVQLESGRLESARFEWNVPVFAW